MLNNHNLMKEGAFRMRNFFLYISLNKNALKDYDVNNILCFRNCDILAVNVETYNSKDKRFKLQQSLSMRPYYISQVIFSEFLYFILTNNPNVFLLRDIRFKDITVEETDLYCNLYEYINAQDYKKVFDVVKSIKEEYDTDISGIKIRYGGYDFIITSDGVLDSDANNEVFYSFINNPYVNNLILGR